MRERVMRGRVLCLTSNFPRWQGDSTTPFVLHLAADLQALGWAVDVLAPHAPDAATEETIDGVHVERFRYAWPESAQTVCYQGGALVNLRKRPLERLKLPALVASEWGAAFRRVLARNYDVVHSHWVLPQGLVGMLATRIPRKPHVVTLHGGDLFALRGRMMEGFKRLALRGADAVTVNSSFTEARVRDLSPGISDLHRIPMGVRSEPLGEAELEHSRRIRLEARRGGGPLLLFVGRLVDEKGAEDALLALHQIGSALPDARLLVVGDGQDRTRLEETANRLELREKCQFVGWVQPHEVRAYMAAADIFIGPSRTASDGWVEAQGLTFGEAMALGTPVIASRLGGIPDTVRHEETGLLVDERSPEQIARAILRIYENPALRERFAEAGRELVRDKLSRQVSAQAFSDLYRSVMHPRK